MPEIAKVRNLLQSLRVADDSVQVMKAAIIQTGGVWHDQSPTPCLYEVQCYGITGLGPSHSSAVDDWVNLARKEIAHTENSEVA